MEKDAEEKKTTHFVNVAKKVAQGAAIGMKRVHQSFGGEYGDTFGGNVVTEDGEYILPVPMIDDRECDEIDFIAKRYDKMTSPGLIAKAGEKAGEFVPVSIKNIAGKVGEAAKDTFEGLTEQELMAAAIKKAADGFGELEKYAAKAGVFKKALTQIGRKMTLKNIGKFVPVVGAGFGALFDTAQMHSVLEFADLFYHKRFIVEKEERVRNLTGCTTEISCVAEWMLYAKP